MCSPHPAPPPPKRDQKSSWTTGRRYDHVSWKRLELPREMKICPTSLITEMQFKTFMFPTHQIGNIFKSLRIPNGEQIWQNRYSYILRKGVQIGTQTVESKLAISSRIDTVEVPDCPAISLLGLVIYKEKYIWWCSTQFLKINEQLKRV